jgi:DNA-binding protein HU-beta
MNKSELVAAVAEATAQSKTVTNEFVDAFLSTVSASIADGEDVVLVGFGTFYRASRKATTGRNPQTGEPLQIPAAKLPKFRAGKKFKEEVNN